MSFFPTPYVVVTLGAVSPVRTLNAAIDLLRKSNTIGSVSRHGKVVASYDNISGQVTFLLNDFPKLSDIKSSVPAPTGKE